MCNQGGMMAKRLDICPKCGEYKELVDHHPFPRRYYGNGKSNNSHSIYLCEDCHRRLDNKIVNEIIRICETVASQDGHKFAVTPQLFVAIQVNFFGSLANVLDILEQRIYTYNLEQNSKRNKNNNSSSILPSLEKIITVYEDMTEEEIFCPAYKQVQCFLEKNMTIIDESRNSKKRRKRLKNDYKRRIPKEVLAEVI